ncbi:succinate dehydrogenase flavoprotein subunit [Sulfobacillus acidophilus TPY]|uniref:Succinate dehydrogenase subunit A n=1 Tax=Sulfobacillus acidophilus (strain ATCC 700253 / DSM 10332 / NAL) TaxID=679936 RepID=G8TY85_SULAD|nr:succinate dehydrogenase flavoprotein subunit [Sulfobacillus acidophilus TPY]AEW05049.1 succinate dehydrogenase subunit A [Sulfobacillus acidophilus DSM 10332]
MARENYETHEYDVIVIGAGGAGLRAAVEASAVPGLKVAVISKSLLGKAHTVMAEGGVAASFGNLDHQDSWETHFYDTMRSGHFINNYRMAEIFAKEAPDRVLELETWGAVFDRTPEGRIMQRPFGAHTFRRLAHIGDHTGMELLRTMQYKAIHSGIDVFQEVTMTKLLMANGRVAGAFGYFREDGRFVLFRAKAVILATGGLGRVYKVTSNSWESTGDGAALAFRAGADLMDMEMVQFHPTGMVWPPGVRGILVTEGVRGEGGLLYNAEGERFMQRYDAERMELSSRDVVARAIFREAMAGRGTPHGGAWLDITHKGPDYIKTKLPGMYEQFLTLADLDITRERFEVAPTCHYTMGGVRVDPETCATNLPGVFAAGEVAAGLHGANRLGGNSLSDILVFGRRAGLGARQYLEGMEGGLAAVDEAEIDHEMNRVLAPLTREKGVNPYHVHEQLQEIMTTYAGIMRSGETLQTGLEKLLALKEEAQTMAINGSRRYNPGWHAVFDVQNMLLLSEGIIRSALERKESRGAHWRTDYPDELPDWQQFNFVESFDGDAIHIRKEPVPEMPEHLARLFTYGKAPGLVQTAPGKESSK